jgi:hypothetical protein
LAVEAKRALSELGKLTRKDEDSKKLAAESDKERVALNTTFWSADKQIYAFALDNQNKRVDEASVLATVPMWFGLLDETNASAMISQLAGHEHMTDWGMRILSKKSAVYSGAGYHFGSVWPLFTGWAAVGEYRYHREQPAYANLRANALLALDGSPGHVTEVLSGDYYQTLSTASPHQIWSAAMVISPVLRGMLGLESDAAKQTVMFQPHLPASWNNVSARDVRVGGDLVTLNYKRTEESLTLEAESTARKGETTLEFRPAISTRAKVLKAELNGRPIAFKVEPGESDQHVVIRIPLNTTKAAVRVAIANDFGVSVPSPMPQLGKESEALRILGEKWSASRDSVDIEVSGSAGNTYELDVRDADHVASVEGATLHKQGNSARSVLSVKIPENNSEPYVRSHVVIHFKPR